MKLIAKDDTQANGFVIAFLITLAALYGIWLHGGRVSRVDEAVLGLGYLIAATQLLPEIMRRWVAKAWWAAASVGSLAFVGSGIYRDPVMTGLAGTIRIELIFSFLPVFLALEAIGIKGRDQNIWLYRAACVGLFAAAVVQLSLTTAFYFVACGIAAVAGDFLVRRIIEGPAWFIDENGERQRIKGRNRGYFIYDPQTRVQRVVREYQVNKERRRALIIWSVMLLPILCTIHWSVALPDSMARWGLTIFFSIVGFGPAVGVLECTVKELIYQTGYQGIDGAKVLDPAPAQPAGLDEVAGQKVHGAAYVASEVEALTQLREGA